MTRLDCRILLAEDCLDTQRLVSHILQKAGADVSVASDGQVALVRAAEATAEGRPFDLVVMDMQMPVMDGYCATRMLRQAGFRGPIVAFTALALSDDREKCLQAGCDDYVTKPIERQELLGVLAHHAARVKTGKLSA